MNYANFIFRKKFNSINNLSTSKLLFVYESELEQP